MDLHGKKESSPEFIEVSLKLSDIFAQKGDLEGAEAGYMHCVTRQTKVILSSSFLHLVLSTS